MNLRLFFVLAGLLGAAQPLVAATLIWTNTAGGNWSDAANWSPNQSPAATDVAVVTNAGTYVVTVPANATIAGLTVGGGAGAQAVQQTGGALTLNGSTRVRSGGTLTFIAGTAGGGLTIDAGGLFVVTGTSTKTINAAITNRGTFQISSTSGDTYLQGNSGARLENEGVLEFEGDRDLYGLNGLPVVRNTGTIRKTGGTGTARLGINGAYPVTLENLGLIESRAGVLQVYANATLAGQISTTTSSARVEFIGGTWTQLSADAPTVTGPGSARFIGGTIRLLNQPANLQLTGGSIVLMPGFQNAGVITNLVIEGATLTGTNTLGGTLRWRDGSITGVLTIENSGLLVIENSVTKNWDASVTNRGTIQFAASTGDVYLRGTSGGRLENSGVLEFAGDRDFYGLNGIPTVRNTGTIRKSAGTGTARLGVNSSYPVTFENLGLLESRAGVLQIYGNATFAGQIVTTTNTARVEWVGGTWTQLSPDAPSITGPGSARFIGGVLQLLNQPPNLQLAGGSIVLLPSFQAGGVITNLILEGSTLTGTNTLAGTLRWRDGSIAGRLTIENTGVMVIENSTTKNWDASVTNRGTIQFAASTGDVYLRGTSGGRLENPGLLEFAGDRDFYGLNGIPTVRNTGTIRKSAGTGTARLGINSSYPVTFENLGLLESRAGVLQIFGNATFAGQIVTTTNTARVEWVGGTWTQLSPDAPSITGPGSARFIGGVIQLLNQPPNLQLAGGSVVLLPGFQAGGAITNLVLEGATLTGTNTLAGTLRWRDGSIAGMLTIENTGVMVVENSPTKNWDASVTNRGTIQLTASTGDVYLRGSSGGRLENLGLLEFAGDRDLYGLNGLPVVRNTGTIRKSAGTGTARLGIYSSYPITLENLGMIESQSGVLQVFGNATLAGQLSTTLASARVELLGGTWTQLSADVPVVSGPGSIRFTAGVLRLLNQIPNLQLTGGSVVLLPGFQGGGAITNLVLEGTSLSGTNVVTGTMRWRDGSLNGVLTIESNALMIIEGGATKTWNAQVTNRGTIQVAANSGDIYFYGANGAQLFNEWLFEIAGDRDLYGINGLPVVRNTGTIRKSAGTGNARLGVYSSYPLTIQNQGVIESQTGGLQVFGNGVLAGELRTTVAAARVEILGGTWSQPTPDVPTVSGPGNSRFTAGVLGLLNAVPGLQLVGGSVLPLPGFQAGGVITNLTLQGAALAGTNRVAGNLVCQSVTGPLTLLSGSTVSWTDGTISGPVTVQGGATLTLASTTTKTLASAVTNFGTVQLQGGGSVYLYGNSGARIINEGSWDFQSDADVFGLDGVPLFRNSGQLLKSSGAGLARLGVFSSYPITFENSGSVTAQSGVLQLFGNGNLSGAFATVAGARVELAGTWTQTGLNAPTVTGAGETRFTSGTARLLDRIPGLRLTGGNVAPLPAFQAGGAITNLALEGAALTGTNVVLGTLICQAVSGPLTIGPGAAVTWTAGAWSGPIVIESNAVLTLTTSVARELNGPLTNRGSVFLQNGATLYLYGQNGAQVYSTGLWDFQSDADLYGINGNPPFRNSGLLRKSAGTGSARIGVNSSYPVAFENVGVMEAVSGTLAFFGSAVVTNGTTRIALRALNDYGRLAYFNPVTLGGTFSAYLTGGYQPVVGNKFTVVTFPSATNVFTSQTLPEGIVWQTDYAAANVSLTVLGACTPAPQDLLAWWSAEGTADDALGSHDGGQRNGAAFATGRVGQAFNLDGANDYIEVPDDAAWSFGTNNFSSALWVNFRSVRASTLGNPAAFLIGHDEGSGNLNKWAFGLGGGFLNVHLNGPGPGPRFLAQTAFNPQLNTWYHLAFSRSNGVYRVFTNGVQAASQTDASPIADIAAPLTLGSAEGAGFLDGLLDEVILVNRALSGAEIAAIYGAGPLGLCRPSQPPVIVNQPLTRTNAPGTVATFTVAASGSFPLSYQWRFNGAPLANDARISGALTPTLSVSGVTLADAGAYSVAVSNPAGSTNSFPAQLFVDALPPVISQLTNVPGIRQAVVSWQTDEPSTEAVEYGLTAAYTLTNRFNGALRTQHGITLTSLIPGTLYHYRVRSADAVGNEAVSVDRTFTTLQAPDLIVSAITVPSPAVFQSGVELTIRWTLTNAGAASVVDRYYDRLLVRNNTTGVNLRDVSLLYDPAIAGNSPIPSGGTRTFESKFRLPDGPSGAGSIAISVTTDYFDALTEWSNGAPGETNNTTQITINSALPPYPDLQVAALRVEPTNNLLSGSALYVLWQTTNTGNGPAAGLWWDRVLIVNTSLNVTLFNGTVPFNSADLGAIAPGASVPRSLSFTLPDSTNAAGQLRVTINADIYDSLFEYAAGRNAETNNAAAVSASVALSDYPDLRVASASIAPASPLSGSSLTINWRLTNAGNAPVAGSFSDRVTLRRTNGTQVSTVNVLYDSIANGSIAPGDGRDRQASVILPDGTNGTGGFQIEIAADAQSQVLEINGAGNAELNNTRTNAFVAALAAYPDLVAGAITNPPSALPGSTVQLRWALTNVGVGPVSGSWSEQVYWSDDAVVGGDQLLATFVYTNAIPAGGFLSRTQSMVLPTLISGPRWFIVRVDSADRVFELNESNNLAIGTSPTAVPVGTTLALAAGSLTEGATMNATLTRNGSLTAAATFDLTSSDPTRLTVPATVTIGAGQSAVGFQVTAPENTLDDGNSVVTVQAAAAGFAPAADTVTVLDNDTPTLTLQLAVGTLTEGDGEGAAVGFISRNTSTNSPLVIPLISSDATRVLVPAQVTIPAGARSTFFSVAIGDNDVINVPTAVAISASLDGYQVEPASFTLLDNDLPALTLSLSQTVIPENSVNPAAFLTISRAAPGGRARFTLVSTNGSAASVPSTATILSNATSVVVPITVYNNAVVDGPRRVELRVIPTDDVSGVPLLTSAVVTNLTVADDEGPALTVTIDGGVIAESGFTTGRVSRNTSTSSNLVVQLASSRTAEATVPATVTINSGQSLATFRIDGVVDGLPDGTKSVAITASAAGFSPGAATLNVSDVDLPDLRPVAVTVTNVALTDTLVPLRFTVTNSGLALAEGLWVDRVYLATSPAGDGLRFVGQASHFTDVPVGGSYTSTIAAQLPGAAGTYYVLVSVDENLTLNDGNRQNNRFVAAGTITVSPAYRATISAALESTVAGTPVPLTGRAFRPADNASVPNVRVTVRTLVKGVRREFDAFADTNGNINTVFRPLPGEAGLVLMGADHPGVATDTTQDTVSIFGLRFADYEITPRIFPHITHTGTVEVVNLGDLPLSGLSASFENLPSFVVPSIQVAEALPASGRVVLTYQLTATNVVSATIITRLRITTAEGATAYTSVRISLQPLTTTLVSTPGLIDCGIARGTQKAISLEVANIGGIASGDLSVVAPDLSWITLSSPSNLPSLGPGESTRVTLLVTPPATAALTLFNAQLYVLGANARLEVPMRLRVMSTATGDLRVEVQDDYTYYVDGAPRVTNALVRLTDPYTGATVAEGTTFPSGSVSLPGLPEGFYQMRVTASQHASFAGPVEIVAGVESARVVFIDRQTVSYRWTVTPTTIEDRYKIVLEPVFETEVPIPVVTLDNPQIGLLIRAGGESQFELKLSNHGLIAAERVTVTVPIDDSFEFTPLVEVVDVLPAKSTISIPVTVRAKPGAPTLAFNGPNGGGIFAPADLPSCGKTFTGCDALPEIKVKWSWICGADRRWHGLQADLEMSCAKPDCWDNLQDLLEDKLKDNAKKVIKGKGIDLKGLPTDCACDLINAAAICLGITDPCALALMKAACGIATKDLGTAVGGGAAAGANCICPNWNLPSYKPSTPGDIPGGGGGTYYSSPASLGKPAEQPIYWDYDGGDCEPGLHGVSVATGGSLQPAGTRPGGVCARVRLRLEQEAALTRQAFLGALEIDNGNPDFPLTGVQVTLDIRDAAGQNANDRFAVLGPDLSGLSAVNGTGTIAARGKGSAKYTFVPTREAAPDAPQLYRFGGTLVYYNAGTRVEVPLAPEPLTVFPDPSLNFDYFLQRDVFSDDPFTDEIEPSEPFALGLLVRNLGKGPARNLRITSSQPTIIENEKGLLIDFKLIGTQVGNKPITPSLTLSMGDIEAGKSQIATFLMTSTLQGKFIEYNASFQHLDVLGDERTSLLDSVTLHELIHVVRADRAGDDALSDFLVNDVPDIDNLPDTLWFSNGSQAPVSLATGAAASAPVTADRLQVQVNASMPAGWTYLRLADPGPRFRLYRVVRSDGKEIAVGTNAWTTDRSFPSTLAGAIRENLFHLVDFNGTGSYTLYYRILDGVAPAILSVGAGVPTVQTGPLSQIDIVTSERIEFASFSTADLVLTRNGGGNLITAGVTITNIGTNVYRVLGLAPLTGADGNYRFTVLGADIIDAGGNAIAGDGVFAWAKGVDAPVVASITQPVPNPRNVAVTNLDITFTQPIDAGTFTLADLTLTRDGGGNLLNSTASLTPINATTFRLDNLQGLTLADGVYAVTAFGAGVTTSNGTPGLGFLTQSWSMLTAGPTITELESVTPSLRNIVVQALTVTFARPINPASFDWRDLTLSRNGGPNLLTSDVQVNSVDDTTYRISNFSWVQGTAGAYALVVSTTGIQDPAGNSGFGTRTQSWTLDLTKPIEPRQLAIAPDTGASANDAITASNQVVLAGVLAETGLTVRVYDDTVGADLGTATVNGTSFTKAITFGAAGGHALRVYSVDSAQNVSSNVNFPVFIDQTAPNGSLAAVTPNPRTNPVPSIEFSFSEPVNPSTVTRAAFSLRRDGGPNLISPVATITTLSPAQYRLHLTNLNVNPGNYELTLNLPSIEDLAGNRGSGVLTQSWTLLTSAPNRPPVLTAITNRSVPEGAVVRLQVEATDPDLPAQTLTYSLGAGAPTGSAIDPDTGLFTWRPSSIQGPADYVVAVVVRDSGFPNLAATRSFVINVRDTLPDVVVSVGDGSVLGGQTSSVPVRYDSGIAVTNLSFEIAGPRSRLTNLVLQAPSVDVLGSTWQPLGSNRYRATVLLRPETGAATNQTLLRVGFVADNSNTSGTVEMVATNVVAIRSDATAVPNTAGRAGRIVLVGDQPVLVAVSTPERTVTVFGRPGLCVQLQSATTLINPVWSNVGQYSLSGQSIAVPLPANPAPTIFYRAILCENPAAPFLVLRVEANQTGTLVLSGQPGVEYLIQRKNSLQPGVNWAPLTNLTLNSTTGLIPGLTLTNAAQFYRAVKP